MSLMIIYVLLGSRPKASAKESYGSDAVSAGHLPGDRAGLGFGFAGSNVGYEP